MKKILEYYKQKQYHNCLKILKKYYAKDTHNPNIYFLFFLVYRRLKNKKKSLFWLRHGFNLIPDNIKLAQLYAYYLVAYLKNPEEALIPLSRLVKNKKVYHFTNFIISKYYYKKDDLERSMLFARASLKENKINVYRRWYFYLLYKYRMIDKLRSYNEYYFVRRLTQEMRLEDQEKIKSSADRLALLKSTGIIKLEPKDILSPIYQYWIFQKYFFSGSFYDFSVRAQILKEGGINIKELLNKKMGKNRSLFDENLIKILSVIGTLILLYYIIKGVF